MKKVAIYGGSFDPPHKGHRLLAKNLAKACRAEKVIIIPTALSPFKKSTSATATDRLKMCQFAFSDSLFEISDTEIKRGGKSYTVDTLTEIKGNYPDSELFLFMGDDMLLSFNRWHKYEEILKLATIVCACRSDEDGILEKMQSFSENELGLESGQIIICKAEPIEISSTEIRKGNETLKRKYLDGKVFDYINQKGLYK